MLDKTQPEMVARSGSEELHAHPAYFSRHAQTIEVIMDWAIRQLHFCLGSQ